MRSLLTKASQAHRCGCRACSTVVSGFGRRVTAAPRRKATFAEVFTACYSSVFASATIIDAVRKEERRQDLDRQLEEVRTELAELKGQSEQDEADILSSLSWLHDGQMEALWDSMKEVLHSRPYMKEIHHPTYPSISNLRAKLQKSHYNTLDPKAISNNRQKAETEFLDLIERAMIFEESERSISRRGPKDHRHLHWFSKHMEKMIGDLMSERRVWARHGDDPQSPSFEEAQELLNQGFPRYKLASVDPDAARENSINLNRANREAIANRAIPYKERVGRVCYNLLMSAYPPDMHSFNALLVAFTRVPALKPLNRHVIDTFFHGTYFLPTPTTYPAILSHLGDKRYRGDFLFCLTRMAGLDESGGAKVRRRHIDDVNDDPRLQAWALETEKRTWTGEYVYDHAPLNALAVDRILQWLLSSQMIDAAVFFLGSCVQAGVKLTSRAVKQVLDECLCALDWSGGVRLIRLLAKDADMWPSMLGSFDEASTAYLIDRVYSILDMVGLDITNRPVSDMRLAGLDITTLELREFAERITWTNDSLPSEVTVNPQRGGNSLYESSRRSRSRLLQLESIEKEYMRVCATTLSIERKLANPEYLPLDFCVFMVQHIGKQTLNDSERLAQDAQKALRWFSRRPSWHDEWRLSRKRREQRSTPARPRTNVDLSVSTVKPVMVQAANEEPRGRDPWTSPESWWEPRALPYHPQHLRRVEEERDTMA